MKRGLATLVMLSSFAPESSAGSIVRFGAVSGPGALIVKFTSGLRVEPLSFVALAWTVNCPSLLVGLGNCKQTIASGLLIQTRRSRSGAVEQIDLHTRIGHPDEVRLWSDCDVPRNPTVIGGLIWRVAFSGGWGGR